MGRGRLADGVVAVVPGHDGVLAVNLEKKIQNFRIKSFLLLGTYLMILFVKICCFLELTERLTQGTCALKS